MKRLGIRKLRKFLRGERGQSAVIAVLTATTIMSLAGAALESGHIYYAYDLLQASTNAAALAGANAMPNTTQAATYVTSYSSGSGDFNATPLLSNAVATPTFLCLNTVENTFQVGCSTSTGATGGYNALSVKQTATVNLWFGGLIGVRSLNLTAYATAAMRGGGDAPWNIAIVVDTTQSMSDSDSSGQCTGTKISCALSGVQSLLEDLYPCDLGQTCSASSGVTNVDSVSMFVFPAMTTSTEKDDWTCPGSGKSMTNPTIVAYTFPDVPTNLTLPSADTYELQFTPSTWTNNYKTTDGSSTVNASSQLGIAAGASGVSGCTGISAPGGEGTYYAQAIYAAQAALVAQQNANPGSSNAMIILTDGDATACATNANTSAGACSTKSQIVATEGTLNGLNSSTSVTYPSALGECGQAVVAAQAAATAGTIVYTIGYGAETSGGCASDAKYSASVTNGDGVTWAKGDQPCKALEAMASSVSNFYSDDETGSGLGCEAAAPSNQNITKLTAIFRAIANNMSQPRLLPYGTT